MVSTNDNERFVYTIAKDENIYRGGPIRTAGLIVRTYWLIRKFFVHPSLFFLKKVSSDA